MRPIHFLFLSLLLIALNACSGDNKGSSNKTEAVLNPELDSLYKLVVAKHDEVMPKTSNINSLQQTLRDDMENMGKEEADKARKDSILNLLSNLQSAHDAMFEWMREFKNLHLEKEFYQKTNPEDLKKYLISEEAKIDRVAKMMLESIGNAELFLKK